MVDHHGHSLWISGADVNPMISHSETSDEIIKINFSLHFFFLKKKGSKVITCTNLELPLCSSFFFNNYYRFFLIIIIDVFLFYCHYYNHNYRFCFVHLTLCCFRIMFRILKVQFLFFWNLLGEKMNLLLMISTYKMGSLNLICCCIEFLGFLFF